MGRIWSDENKFRCWLQVEVAASLTLAQAGIVPRKAAQAIAERGDFNLQRIQEVEAEVKHDVIAFTTAVAEKVGPESRWLHYGLTSNDVVDTAQALQIKEASHIILQGLARLRDVLARRAKEFKRTPAIGRTHGIHAEPTTFGLRLANWYSETQRNIGRFERAAEDMRVGKLARVVRSNAQAAFENVALWHERDISHSSAERVILPDSTILVDYLLHKTANLIDTLLVYPERMMKNLESTGGLVFSGQLLLDLAENGMSREDAYRLVQKHAMRVWKENLNFRELVMNDPEITSPVPTKHIEQAFRLKRPLRTGDKI